eukprot:1137566-Pelagomonas_calceolata.AAC.1
MVLTVCVLMSHLLCFHAAPSLNVINSGTQSSQNDKLQGPLRRVTLWTGSLSSKNHLELLSPTRTRCGSRTLKGGSRLCTKSYWCVVGVEQSPALSHRSQAPGTTACCVQGEKGGAYLPYIYM